MSFGPESNNPRERRAYAHTMVEAHRRREVTYDIARQAVEAVVENRKGQSSGLLSALGHAASYSAVENAGADYRWLSWPTPENPEKVHMMFKNIPGSEEILGVRHPVTAGTEQSWKIVRDELAARGYGMHDAGHGNDVVAVVLDRPLAMDVKADILFEHGLAGYPDPRHQTVFV